MKKYFVDKNYILNAIAKEGKTVSQFCEEEGFCRNWFYHALRRSYEKPRSIFISRRASKLGLEDSLLWKE